MKRTLALFALATACGPAAADAQTPPAGHAPTLIVVRPAAEPRPALKYRLVPERRSLVPGNAALFYHRAIESVIDKRGRSSVNAVRTPGAQAEFPEERIANWVSGPIADIPRDEAQKLLEVFQIVLDEVELGAARASCDWEFDRRQEGIRLLLREIQEMRAVARLVALRARVAVLDGKTDEALHWIQTGLVVGRHVGEGPIVIQALVGIAIDMVMLRCLEDAIQAPGTASLYWALADRPRPFIDMRSSMEGERYLLEKEIPGLDQLRRGPWSLDEARRFADDLQRKLYSFNSGQLADGGPSGIPSFTRRLGIAAMASKIYPAARKALVEQGFAADEVERMPVIQVAVLHTLREYERVRDDTYKWMQVPYWQSYDRMDRSVVRALDQKLANPLLALFETLMPALRAARLASLRLDRQLDALQCVEAVRLHAALHGGKLPSSLDAIADAPVPLDPITGKPFSYTVDGNSAVLFAPEPPGYAVPQFAIRYALKLAD